LTQDANEIEELVRLADQEKGSAARYRLFRALRDVELFFPVKIKHYEGKEVRATPLLRLQDGTNAMMLYTSRSHPDLPNSYGGGSFKDALTAASKMPALDWVIVSNRASQWVSVRKEQISSILGDLDTEGKEENGFAMTPESDSANKFLEELITRAARSAPEEVSPPINSALSGRELYIDMTTGQNEDDRPATNIFQVDEIRNVVRAYLTRNRPGITYGGMRWEVLKEMIRNEPRIDGVQIVNDADDWVVFDRESLGFGRTGESR
jgi:hypothetical protein